jgi:hypothetical protein
MILKKYLLLSVCFFVCIPSLPAQDQGIPRSTTFDNKEERLSEVSSEKLRDLQPGIQAQQFIEMARQLMADGKYSQAKEALRTAIRIEPMNPEAWALYDEALIAEYVDLRRKEKLEPVIEQDLSPLFEINRVDTYIELDTLFVVGSLKNLSDSLKQKIRVTARILDENKKELRQQSGELNLTNRGLLPNESSLFEIPFKNPPAGARSFKVEVSNFE